MSAMPPHTRSHSLLEVALLFLKLGTFGFGGPAAHIALMQEEVVRRRGWLSNGEFIDLLGATNLIPGPNSTEMAIHIGHRRAGAAGLIVAGVCFILPATLIVLGCAWLYVAYGTLPQAQALLYGIKPVLIAIVLQALWNLRKAALKTTGLAVLAAAVCVLMLLGANELVLLFGAGAIVALGSGRYRGHGQARMFFPLLPVLGAGATAAPGVWPIFAFFLKIGAVLYGSGYVLLAFLRAGLVERHGWLTETQLLDAVAIGQVTPGPLFTTATFIGYLLGGLPGALAATAGIFLPAFLFVALSVPVIPRIRRSPLAGAFLDGVNAASLALMAAVTLQLGQAALVDATTAVLALGAVVALLRFKVSSMSLIAVGAGVGLLAHAWT